MALFIRNSIFLAGVLLLVLIGSPLSSVAQGGFPCEIDTSDTYSQGFPGAPYFDDAPDFNLFPNGFEVVLPFSFCFYDVSYNSFFLNNNGNITFGEQWTTFTASGFPDANVPPMIAPFWGDVDTGDDNNPLGDIRYEIFPNYAIVRWDSVNVYPNADPNQRNTFQLIISDGTGSILPGLANVGFIYGDMQWTTGTASGGIGGFGGIPATVGVNRGDGFDYIQLGRFDAPGYDYDGPFGTNDQVDFLDKKYFFFNVCNAAGSTTGANIPPILVEAYTQTGTISDTINLCTPTSLYCDGNPIDFEFSFIPVESDQTIDVALANGPIPGLALNPIFPTTVGGEPITVTGTYTPVAGVFGLQEITFNVTDILPGNIPGETYVYTYTVDILPLNFLPQIIGPNDVCEGTNVVLAVAGAGGNSIQYEWSPGLETTSSINVPISGVYSVTVTIGACTGVSDPFPVTIHPTPTPIIEGESVVCINNPASTAEISVNQSYSNYAWFNMTGFPINNASFQTVSVGAGDYLVEVIDQFGCTGTSPVFTVNALPSPTPSILGNAISCFNNTVVLAADMSYNTYEWFDLSTNLLISSDSAILVLEGFYRLNVSDGGGCEGSDIFSVVNFNPVSDAGPTPPPICSNEPAPIGAPALPSHSYLWQPAFFVADSLASSTTASFVNLSDEPIEYQIVLLTTLSGCTAFDTVTITINPQPSAYFDVPEPQCFENNSFDFNAEGDFNQGATFNWNFGPSANPSSSSDANPEDVQFNGTGIHNVTLTITDAGCESFDFELPVIIRPMPVANFTADAYDGCAPLPVNFSNGSNSQDPISAYFWDFGDGNTSGEEAPLNQYDEPGNYSVSLAVATEYGCRDTFKVNNLFTVYPNAIAKFTLEPTVVTLDNPHCIFSDYSLNSNEVEYRVAFLDTFFKRNLTYTFQDTGTFPIQQIVSNEFGCTDSLTLYVRVNDGFNLFIPNSFSPDGDGKNDYFKVYGQDIRFFSMKVYSRWGQLLYSSNDYESGWDGTTRLSDVPLPSGTYFYIIDVVDIQNNSKTVEGMFSIHR
jgi:gliding motility-associated-like protein